MIDITFLGTAADMPETGGDSTCYLINERILVDTGWYSPMRLPLFGHDPLKITHLLFTHFHPDHCIALPQLLLQRSIEGAKREDAPRPLPPLTIAGPGEELKEVVQLAHRFAFRSLGIRQDDAVLLSPLKPGDSLEIDALTVTVGRASHGVAAHSYRFTDQTDGVRLGITGDTRYTEELAVFFQGVDLLVAEASFGKNAAWVPTAVLHMGAPDAARLASKAGAKRLALVHARQPRRAEAVTAAQAIFPDTFWPTDGQRVNVV